MSSLCRRKRMTLLTVDGNNWTFQYKTKSKPYCEAWFSFCTRPSLEFYKSWKYDHCFVVARLYTRNPITKYTKECPLPNTWKVQQSISCCRTFKESIKVSCVLNWSATTIGALHCWLHWKKWRIGYLLFTTSPGSPVSPASPFAPFIPLSPLNPRSP